MIVNFFQKLSQHDIGYLLISGQTKVRQRCGDVSEEVQQQITAWMQRRMTRLQEADRDCWRPGIAELKRPKAEAKLMPEDGQV